jgi:excisionase family DNA binding protein
MATIYFPTEIDFKRWIKEALREHLAEVPAKNVPADDREELFISRKEIAKRLNISLVTLTDWVKRGLPSHKYRNRVYFLYSEVIAYIKENKIKSNLTIACTFKNGHERTNTI